MWFQHVISGLAFRTEIVCTSVLSQQNVEDLLKAGYELADEQNMVMNMKLSEEYMKTQTGPGGGLSISAS